MISLSLVPAIPGPVPSSAGGRPGEDLHLDPAVFASPAGSAASPEATLVSPVQLQVFAALLESAVGPKVGARRAAASATAAEGDPTTESPAAPGGGATSGSVAGLLAAALADALGGATPVSADAPVADTGANQALRDFVERVAGSTSGRKPGVPDKRDKEVAPAPTVAGATPPVTAPVDPTLVVRDPAALQPAFRQKLDRVISRMKNEYGQEVHVVETWRSQARQDLLYGQGRTQPGPIVTWTQHSQHAEGRAADVVIAGHADDPSAYQHLAQIADEEGLRTLGPRDPGHIEMVSQPTLDVAGHVATIAELSVSATPRAQAGVAPARSSVSPALPATAAFSPDSVAAAPARPTLNGQPLRALVAPEQQAQDNSGSSDLPRRAAGPPSAQPQPGMAPPSEVVARVARVGRVAVPAAVTQPAPVGRVATIASVASVAAPTSGRTGGSPTGQDDRPRGDQGSTKGLATAAPDGREREELNALAIASVSTTEAGSDSVATASQALDLAPAPNTNGARASEILALQDAKDSQPVSHMVLRLDNADGGQDRIRVDLRGSSVGATIDTQDPAVAAQLSNRMHELSSALENRGLAADSLRVRAAAASGPVPSADLARAVAAGAEPAMARLGLMSTDAGSASSRQRGDQQGQRPQQDSSRNRSRREPKEQTR